MSLCVVPNRIPALTLMRPIKPINNIVDIRISLDELERRVCRALNCLSEVVQAMCGMPKTPQGTVDSGLSDVGWPVTQKLLPVETIVGEVEDEIP